MRLDLYPRASAVDGTELQLIVKNGATMTASVAQTQGSASVDGLTALIATLPTTLPATAGRLWVNGGVLCVS